jgi:hypothetical protein
VKYILSQKQYNLLVEGKQQIFQSLLNNSLKGIQKDCEDIDADTFPNDLSFASCDVAESVKKIDIIDFETSKDKFGRNNLKLKVNLEYESVINQNHSHLLFDISKRINDWLGIPVMIELGDSINTKVKEW